MGICICIYSAMIIYGPGQQQSQYVNMWEDAGNDRQMKDENYDEMMHMYMLFNAKGLSTRRTSSIVIVYQIYI